MKKIAVLITCHNRREKTLACLEALYRCRLPDAYHLETFVVDDGSQDGTADAIRLEFPIVHLLKGNGNLFWNGGMRLAFAAGIKQGFDYYLWLNDDTILYKDTLIFMLKTGWNVLSQNQTPSIIVGATQDELNGVSTYGGLRRCSSFNPLKLKLVSIANTPQPCETMNGNCVLIPKVIATKLGNLDEAFIHSMGDIDYGFRAIKAGFRIFVMPNFAGICQRNAPDDIQRVRRLNPLKNFEKIIGPKRLPPKSWYVLTSRHGGFLWPLLWVWPYFKAITGLMR